MKILLFNILAAHTVILIYPIYISYSVLYKLMCHRNTCKYFNHCYVYKKSICYITDFI